MPHRIAWWIAAVVFAAAFLVLSLREDVYHFSVSLIAGALHALPRKVAATFCFGIVSYCVGRATERPGRSIDWAIPVLTGTFFSAFIEIVQHYSGRFFGNPIEPRIWSVIDVLTGTLGGLGALPLLARSTRRQERVSVPR